MNEYDIDEKKPNIIKKLLNSFDPIEKKRKRNERAIKQLELDQLNKELDEQYLSILQERKKLKISEIQCKSKK